MKILVVRFSSIGDIVLTSPVVRCLNEQMANVQVDFLTKKSFQSIVEKNPNITNVYTIEKSISEILETLKANNYDFVIDLHKNTRTRALSSKLGVKSATFPKLNLQKWLLTNFKINKMPDVHIVDRYFEAVKSLGVVNDLKGIDYFCEEDENPEKNSPNLVLPTAYLSVACGAQFATKRMPLNLMVAILTKVNAPIVLLGGPTDLALSEELVKQLPHQKVVNLCGKISLNTSAEVVKKSKAILTHDTGLMHIASAFKIPIISVWGNTVPELGMYAYLPKNPELLSIHEVKNLSCRPCSKIGHQACPKQHFNCMNMQDVDGIVADINKNFIV